MIKPITFIFALNTALVTSLGANFAFGGEDDCTLLHEAAFLDEPTEIQDLLAAGVDVECKDVLGHTAIVTAVNGASMDSFTLLLDAGAKTDVKTEWGNSLLQHTKRKFRSVDHQKGLEQYRDLYQSMIARLQTAGAMN